MKTALGVHIKQSSIKLSWKSKCLAELAEVVERLAKLAYPEVQQEMLELLVNNQFIDTLEDGDTHLRMR